ncbi:unnamed protein product, partial [Closterium sp. NIES-53]
MPGGNTQVLSSRRFCSPSGSRARSSPSSHADRRNSMCDRRTSLFGQRLPCDGSRTTTSMRVRSRKSRRGDDRHRAEGEGVTRGTPSLVCSSKVDDVPHLSEWIPDLQTYTNPLVLNPAYAYVDQYFVEPNDMVCQQVSARLSDLDSISYFRRAGPRER